jgi:Na+/melibiose symporter-like transporter
MSCIIFQLFLLVDRIGDSTARFSLNILLVMCWTLCYSSLQPLLDSLVIKMIPDRTLYGAQRAWLSIGFAIITSTVGSVIDSHSHHGMKNQYYPLFYIYSIATVVFTTACYFIVPNDTPREHFAAVKMKREMEAKSTSSMDSSNSSASQYSLWSHTYQLLSKPKFAILLLIAVIFGYSMQNMVSSRSANFRLSFVDHFLKKTYWETHPPRAGKL